MMQVEVRSFDGTGGGGGAGFIPKASDVSVMEELNGDGAVSFSAPLSSPGVADLVAMQEAMLVVSVDGEPIDAWGLLDADADDLTDGANEARPVAFSGTGLRRLLADAVTGLATPTAPNRTYTDRTPGYILWNLFTEARVRGTLLEAVPNFDQYVPTTPYGPWLTADVTRTYEAATTLLDVLDGLITDGLVDSRMAGWFWEVYDKDDTTSGLNRLRSSVILSRSWYRTAQRRQSRAPMSNLVLGYTSPSYIAGPGSYGPGRNREGYVLAPGLTPAKSPALGLLVSRALVAGAYPRKPSTLSYLLTPERPAPWVDYRIGDRIYAEGFGDDPLRVRSMTATQLESGATEVTLELNDVQTELDLANARVLDKITRGVS